LINFNLYIYNDNSIFGTFGLCVIYNNKGCIPLIKGLEDDKAEKMYNYCIINNIYVLKSDYYEKYHCYTNFVEKSNGYSQISGVYLEQFYSDILVSIKNTLCLS